MFSAVANAQKPGEVLVGEYTYYDAEGDLEYGSTYQWYRGDTPIPGATDINYTITEEDIGTILYFEVTPRSLTGISPGEPFKSEGIMISVGSDTTSGGGGGVLPLPTPTGTTTPVITYTSTSTVSTSTATTTPTPTSSSTISGNITPGHYLSPLDGKVYVCNPFNSYMKINSRNNNVDEVKLWQIFLNREVGAKLPITGFYGPMTFAATKDFQNKYAKDVLNPWDITSATGYTYKSTRYKANKLLGCTEVPVTLDNGVVINY